MPVLTSTIRIEVVGGFAVLLLAKDSKLPKRVKNRLTPSDKEQSQMEIHIVYGENVIASDNHTLARFVFDGLSSQGKSKPFLKLAVDKKMQMSITVKDRATGLRHDVESIDLSQAKSPSIVTPLPYIGSLTFFDSFFGSRFSVGPKTGEADELARVILRLLAPDSLNALLTNRDNELDKYDLSSQQRRALELINAETVERYLYLTLYKKVKRGIGYLEEHPDAVLCPTCSGTGNVQKVQQRLLGTIVDFEECHTCSGIGLIQS